MGRSMHWRKYQFPFGHLVLGGLRYLRNCVLRFFSLVLRYKIPNCYSVGTKNKLKTSVKDNRHNFTPASLRELTNWLLRLLLQRLSQEITTNNKKEEGKEMSVLDSDPQNHCRKWSYLWTNNKLCEKSGTRESDPLQPSGMPLLAYFKASPCFSVAPYAT